MAGESKGTEAASLGGERGSRDGWRWRKIAAAWLGSDEGGAHLSVGRGEGRRQPKAGALSCDGGRNWARRHQLTMERGGGSRKSGSARKV
jgi:hypothetical protein